MVSQALKKTECLEVLRGFRSDKDFNIARELLLSLEVFDFCGKELALKCAASFRFLGKTGDISASKVR